MTASSSPASSAAAAVPADYPERLDIPALGIDANVQHTGITARGTIGTPNNFTDVAWYKYGLSPGDRRLPDRRARRQRPRPRRRLQASFEHPGRRRRLGDEGDGSQVSFVVTDIESYPYTAVPPSAISARSGPARLILITCGGDWVPGGDTYDHRLVITAELATSTP